MGKGAKNRATARKAASEKTRENGGKARRIAREKDAGKMDGQRSLPALSHSLSPARAFPQFAPFLTI